MRIAVDFDDTYTADEILFAGIIRLAIERGHDVKFVTARVKYTGININSDIERAAQVLGIDIIYCEHESKQKVCNDLGWTPHVWMDDTPDAIVLNSPLLLDLDT